MSTTPLTATSHSDGRDAELAFRRLTVFDVPSGDALLFELQRIWPGTSFRPVSLFEELAKTKPSDEVVPVYFWPQDAVALYAQAGDILRGTVYPLVASGVRFAVGFSFARSALSARRLDIDTLPVLDLETIGSLLTDDVVCEEFAALDLLMGRIPLTPIERPLQDAMVRTGLDPIAQVKIDRYRVDFLLRAGDRHIVVEADGAGFHVPERDAARDARLRDLGIEEVLRFSGSRIHADADGCAKEVSEVVAGGRMREPAAVRRQQLDRSQTAAVGHRQGPARVLAPAGAGKTRVLVNRIAALIEDGVDPAAILALAFNKKASDQLERALLNLGISVARANESFNPTETGVRCATFNAFGMRYQKQVIGSCARLEPSATFWREMMRGAISRAGASLNGATRGSDPVAEFLHQLELVRADLRLPDELAVEIDDYKAGRRDVNFGPVYTAFQRLRLDRGTQAFGDQLHVALVDLLGSPSHREFVQGMFTHVLVDEYQDLNAAQLALIDVVSRPQWNLYVVGDDDQLIYGWRFAELTNILDFHKRVPAKPFSETYTLQTNYRCSQAIVETSRRVIAHNHIREPKDIRPAAGAERGEVLYAQSASFTERSDAMVDFLRGHGPTASKWCHLAVLCRYKAQQQLVALALDRAEIPRTRLLKYRLFSDREIRLLRAYIELVWNPTALTGEDLAYLVNRPNRYISRALVDEISRHTQPWACLTELADNTDEGVIKRSPRQALCALRDRRERLFEKYTMREPASLQLVDDVIRGFGLDTYWGTGSARRDRDEANTAQLLSLVKAYAEEMPDRTEFLAHWDATAEGENADIDMSDDTLGREESADADGVVIGTIHASKGREYDAVVLWDYASDLGRLDAAAIEEERRVFYVGLTRARNAALITIDGHLDELHQFVRESIEPAQVDEEVEVAQQLQAADAEERAVVVERHRVAGEIRRIADGTVQAVLVTEQAGLDNELAEADDELKMLLPLVQSPSILSRLNGKTKRAQAAIDALAQRLVALREQHADIAGRLALLEADPELAARPLLEELEGYDDRLSKLRGQRRRLLGRRSELQLL